MNHEFCRGFILFCDATWALGRYLLGTFNVRDELMCEVQMRFAISWKFILFIIAQLAIGVSNADKCKIVNHVKTLDIRFNNFAQKISVGDFSGLSNRSQFLNTFREFKASELKGFGNMQNVWDNFELF